MWTSPLFSIFFCHLCNKKGKHEGRRCCHTVAATTVEKRVCDVIQKLSKFSDNTRHWLQRKLSNWQLTLQKATRISPNDIWFRWYNHVHYGNQYHYTARVHPRRESHFNVITDFTRGQFKPSRIVVACVYMCVCMSVSMWTLGLSVLLRFTSSSENQQSWTRKVSVKILIVFKVHWPWPPMFDLTYSKQYDNLNEISFRRGETDFNSNSMTFKFFQNNQMALVKASTKTNIGVVPYIWF